MPALVCKLEASCRTSSSPGSRFSHPPNLGPHVVTGHSLGGAVSDNEDPMDVDTAAQPVAHRLGGVSTGALPTVVAAAAAQRRFDEAQAAVAAAAAAASTASQPPDAQVQGLGHRDVHTEELEARMAQLGASAAAQPPATGLPDEGAAEASVSAATSATPPGAQPAAMPPAAKPAAATSALGEVLEVDDAATLSPPAQQTVSVSAPGAAAPGQARDAGAKQGSESAAAAAGQDQQDSRQAEEPAQDAAPQPGGDDASDDIQRRYQEVMMIAAPNVQLPVGTDELTPQCTLLDGTRKTLSPQRKWLQVRQLLAALAARVPSPEQMQLALSSLQTILQVGHRLLHNPLLCDIHRRFIALSAVLCR